MAKRPSLAETMKQAMREDEPPPGPVRATDPPSPARQPQPRPVAGGFHAPTRAGKKKVTANLDPSERKRLKMLAAERETTTESLLVEAIHDLFAKYGRPPI